MAERADPVQHTIARRIVITTELVMALAALWGGIALLRDPLTPIGLTQDYIAPTWFTTYTWPGVLLIALNGVIPALIAGLVVARYRWALELSVVWGAGLVAWILVQWLWLSGTYPVQFFCFAAGIVTVIAAAAAGAFRPTPEVSSPSS